jgi:hypothetical protein
VSSRPVGSTRMLWWYPRKNTDGKRTLSDRAWLLCTRKFAEREKIRAVVAVALTILLALFPPYENGGTTWLCAPKQKRRNRKWPVSGTYDEVRSIPRRPSRRRSCSVWSSCNSRPRSDGRQWKKVSRYGRSSFLGSHWVVVETAMA